MMSSSSKRVYAPKKKYKRSYKKSEKKYPTKKAKPSFITLRPGTPSLFTQLIYCEAIELDAGLGLAALHAFALNNLNDPNASGIGHQPVNYDQLGLIWSHYCVYGCKWKVTFANSDSTNQVICFAGVSDSVTTSTDVYRYIENGSGETVILNARGGSDVGTISGYTDMAKTIGISRTDLLGDRLTYGAAFGSSPEDLVRLNIVVSALASTADPGAVRAMVELTFYCKITGSQLNSLS